MANPKLRPEDLPVEEIVDLFLDMPCQFTEDDFREEYARTERRLKAERERVS